MDVDGGNSGGPQTPLDNQQQQQQQQPTSVADIDMSFLQQFSCLGTTDHDELVNQLQKIMGNQLNLETARFFLDMNNWNLQAAVGCYFDFNTSQRLPSMKILGDETVGGGEGVTPNTEFIQSWRIQNTGEEQWPPGCYLKCTSHPIEGNSLPLLPSSQLQPGESMVVSVNVRSPETMGSFQAKWRVCTAYGSYFGDIMWLIVQVSESGTLALTQQLSSMQTRPDVLETDAVTRQIQPFADIPFGPNLQLMGPLNMSAIEASSTIDAAPNGAQLPLPDDAEMW